MPQGRAHILRHRNLREPILASTGLARSIRNIRRFASIGLMHERQESPHSHHGSVRIRCYDSGSCTRGSARASSSRHRRLLLVADNAALPGAQSAGRAFEVDEGNIPPAGRMGLERLTGQLGRGARVVLRSCRVSQRAHFHSSHAFEGTGGTSFWSRRGRPGRLASRRDRGFHRMGVSLRRRNS